MKEKLSTFIWAAIALMTGFTTTVSCTDYQDEIDAIDTRVTRLEELVSTTQTNINALKSLVVGMGENWYVTNYMPTFNEKGDTTGYVINMRKDSVDPVTGEVIEGKQQVQTVTIKNGEPGDNAQFPDIEPRKNDQTGEWYWVIVTTDDNGNKVETPITDAKKDTIYVAKDAVSPEVRINPTTKEWEISTDGGKTWKPTGVSAVGKEGKEGKRGSDGDDSSDTAITKIEQIEETKEGVTTSLLKFTTGSGSTFTLPYYEYYS